MHSLMPKLAGVRGFWVQADCCRGGKSSSLAQWGEKYDPIQSDTRIFIFEATIFISEIFLFFKDGADSIEFLLHYLADKSVFVV